MNQSKKSFSDEHNDLSFYSSVLDVQYYWCWISYIIYLFEKKMNIDAWTKWSPFCIHIPFHIFLNGYNCIVFSLKLITICCWGSNCQISQYWFRLWLDAIQMASHYLTTSRVRSPCGVTRPQWVNLSYTSLHVHTPDPNLIPTVPADGWHCISKHGDVSN